MKAFLTAVLCLCTLAAFSDCVTVQVGEFSFPLESVKKLKDLLDSSVTRNPHVLSIRSASLCANPDIPKEFLKLCATPDADQIFEDLKPIARSPELCEICAFAACAGC
ncbi:guanylin [Malaclemys terrapin pileata]|uniref:guanylin n=1 Tax=Malaclemys terrapin pileata TaxID=2991368 RepID=UPI0023A85C81|nr:guanylin [Malaclemys terrapin pileata]XP_053865343.1 guanylin [Malaclemys terrapin pileata]